MPVCLECGIDNAKNTKYCENCGARMTESKPTFSSSELKLPTLVAEKHVWQSGGWIEAIRTFYFKPKAAKALFEDHTAPNALILFGIGLFVAILHSILVSLNTVTRSYLNGELIGESRGSIVFAILGTLLQWILGTAILAILIASGLHFQSYLKHNENPFVVALKLNGLRSLPNWVYLIVSMIAASVYPDRVVETYSESTAPTSLLIPEVAVVSGPPREIDILLLSLQMVVFVLSYVVLYRGLTQTLELRGILFKIVIGLYFLLTMVNFVGSVSFLL